MTDEDIKQLVREFRSAVSHEVDGVHLRLDAIEGRLLAVEGRLGRIEERRDEWQAHLHSAEAGWVNVYRDLAARVSALEERER